MRILKLTFVTVLSFTVFINPCFATNAQQKTFIFFYSGSCKYCHEMADILVKIRQKHKLKIIANSLDGKAITQFPDAIHNNELNRKFRIVSIPTIVAVDVANRSFELVSCGLETQQILEAKMLAVLNG